MKNLQITNAGDYLATVISSNSDSSSIGACLVDSASCIKNEYHINFCEFIIQQVYNDILTRYRNIGALIPTDNHSFKSSKNKCSA